MYKKVFGLLMVLMVFAGTAQAGLQSDINRATCTLAEQSIPSCVLDNAKGVVVMRIVKAGFVFSGRVGHGLVMARLKSGWSAPSALGIAGAGFGLQVGAQVTDFVLILNTQAALDAFSGGGSVSLGGNLSLAVGPVGGSAEGSLMLPPAAIYSYSCSSGAFVGVSLEGTVIVERSGTNQQFYGRPVAPCELLCGDVPPPECARGLYNQL